MEEGGEFGELVIELTATLAKTGVSVSATEQQELRGLWKPRTCPRLPSTSSKSAADLGEVPCRGLWEERWFRPRGN